MFDLILCLQGTARPYGCCCPRVLPLTLSVIAGRRCTWLQGTAMNRLWRSCWSTEPMQVLVSPLPWFGYEIIRCRRDSAEHMMAACIPWCIFYSLTSYRNSKLFFPLQPNVSWTIFRLFIKSVFSFCSPIELSAMLIRHSWQRAMRTPWNVWSFWLRSCYFLLAPLKYSVVYYVFFCFNVSTNYFVLE